MDEEGWLLKQWMDTTVHPQAERGRYTLTHLQEQGIYTFPQALLLVVLLKNYMKGTL